MAHDIIEVFPLEVDHLSYYTPYWSETLNESNRMQKGANGYLFSAYNNFQIAAKESGIGDLFCTVVTNTERTRTSSKKKVYFH